MVEAKKKKRAIRCVPPSRQNYLNLLFREYEKKSVN